MERTQYTFRVNHQHYSPHQPEEPFIGHLYLWACDEEDAKKEFSKILSYNRGILPNNIEIVNIIREDPPLEDGFIANN